jgi:hypothetical protein
VTYSYAASARAALVNGAGAYASARIRGRTAIVARGQIRNHRLTLKFTHLRKGRYRLTLWEMKPHHRSLALGHTVLVVS